MWETCAVDGCRGVRFGVDGQCLLHCSDEALEQLTATGPSAVDLDGRGVTFDQRSLARVLEAIPLRGERRSIGSARFDEATFQHEVSFDGTTFSGPVSFSGARFLADIRFGGAAFAADVSFEEVTFAGQAWFVGTSFQGPVSFTAADFSGPAWFQRTTFAADTRFDLATFSGNVTFSAATFASVSSFTGAEFQSRAVFDKATFAGDSSNWDDVTFLVKGQGPPPSVLPKPTVAPTVNGQPLDMLPKAPSAARACRVRRSPLDRSHLLNAVLPLLAVMVLATTAFIILRPGDGGPVATEDVAAPATTLERGSPVAQIAATSLPPEPATPTPEDGSTAHAFVEMTKGGPVRYNPCEPLRYIVNPTGAPPGWRDVLNQVVDEIARASGLTLKDEGTTDETAGIRDPEGGATRSLGSALKQVDRQPFQPERYPGVWAPVLIRWGDLAPGPGTAGYYELTGFGGSQTRDNADGTRVFVSGLVVVSRTLDLDLLKAALLHEFGHVLGLDHVSDPSQVMAAAHAEPPSSYGAGDLAGLAKVGRDHGCLNTPPPAP